MTAADQVNAIISDAKNTQAAATDKAIQYTDNAQIIAQGYITPNAPPEPTYPGVTAPPYTPDTNLAIDFDNEYNKIWVGLEDWLKQLMADWMGTYIPQLDSRLHTAADDWFYNVIVNGYLGIPVAIENAIWERSRARELLEAIRMEDEAVNHMAARGFAMPPGVLSARLLQVQAEAQDKNSTHSRDVAIKQAEISIDMTKFAIGEVTKLRLGVAQALADFMRAAMELPKAAADTARAYADCKTRLWNSSAEYLNALVNRADLELKRTSTVAGNFLESQKISVAAFDSHLNRQVQAADSAATAMGHIASAALGAQQTLAHIGETQTG